MKSLTVICVVSLVLHLSTAPPVTQKKSEDENNENEIGDDKETGLVSTKFLFHHILNHARIYLLYSWF